MCGLFGFSGKKGKAINISKLIILGLLNEARGKDSCGYYFNGNVDKGTGMESDFSDFVAKNKLKPGDLKTKIFMGHTRKATGGMYNYENAHPHVVESNYTQTHNGVIKNIWELCNKYDVNHTKIHVDSIGLAHLINKVGPKPILEEYKGSAALAFTYMSDPSYLYLYHGESRERQNGLILEERPLFILKQPEGIYYSSLKESLEIINVDPDNIEPFILKHNVVWEVLDGVFTDRILPISREDKNITTNYTINKGGQGHKGTTVLPKQLPLLNAREEEPNDNDLVLSEPYPMDASVENINRVYYHWGKHYEVKQFETTSGVNTILQNPTYVYATKMDGIYVISRDGVINRNPIVPNGREHVYYFVDGVMMKTKQDYEFCVDNCIHGFTEMSFAKLSTMSVYPIIQIKNSQGVGKNLWFHKGQQLKKDTFNPKFCTNNYKIKYGRTKQIFPVKRLPKSPIIV